MTDGNDDDEEVSYKDRAVVSLATMELFKALVATKVQLWDLLDAVERQLARDSNVCQVEVDLDNLCDNFAQFPPVDIEELSVQRMLRREIAGSIVGMYD